MLAQTGVNKGSQAVLRARRGTGGDEFADVYTIAAVTQECYRNIDMADVVAGAAVVRVSWDRCAYIFSESS